ncbi:MAG TPA: sigma-70 family RNA polymerase sigma factor [Terriglobales bacterium]|nr:sigma-70 family RNA polymerase sigma factor [Terriglobales bacterium]
MFKSYLKKDVRHKVGRYGVDASISTSEDDILVDLLEDWLHSAPDEALLDEALRLEIERALRTLSGREAQVISLYFGLTQERPLTLREIGARFGLTHERVRQIKEKAIRRLRQASRNKTLRDYLN